MALPPGEVWDLAQRTNSQCYIAGLEHGQPQFFRHLQTIFSLMSTADHHSPSSVAFGCYAWLSHPMHAQACF